MTEEEKIKLKAIMKEKREFYAYKIKKGIWFNHMDAQVSYYRGIIKGIEICLSVVVGLKNKEKSYEDN